MLYKFLGLFLLSMPILNFSMMRIPVVPRHRPVSYMPKMVLTQRNYAQLNKCILHCCRPVTQVKGTFGEEFETLGRCPHVPKKWKTDSPVSEIRSLIVQREALHDMLHKAGPLAKRHQLAEWVMARFKFVSNHNDDSISRDNLVRIKKVLDELSESYLDVWAYTECCESGQAAMIVHKEWPSLEEDKKHVFRLLQDDREDRLNSE